MDQAKDFWAMADKSLMERWPKGDDGQPEKAEKLHGNHHSIPSFLSFFASGRPFSPQPRAL